MDETGPWAVSEPEPPSPKGGSDLAHASIRQCTSTHVVGQFGILK
jgi:hypothetical protein